MRTLNEKQKQLENLTALFKPEFHILVFSHKDFLEMLLSKEPNFGKELFKKNLIFQNASKYFYLVTEAIEHGFTSKNIS